MIDAIGYTGMGLVLISFLFKDILWVRLINMIGCVPSIIYGVITHTYPTAALNTVLLIINLTHLFIFLHKTRREKVIKYSREEK